MTDRFIISSSDYNPIQTLINSGSYLTASVASSSCNWDDHVWCDVTLEDEKWRLHIQRYILVTASMHRFICTM